MTRDSDGGPPALYACVWYLGHRLHATHVIGVGDVDPEGLLTAYPSLDIIGVLPPRAALPSASGSWLHWTDHTNFSPLPNPPARAIVLCSGLSWLDDPEPLLQRLKEWSGVSSALIVAGDPDESPEALDAVLRESGLSPDFLGRAESRAGHVPMALVAPNVTPRLPVEPTPESFRVTAIMTSYNEGDIIAASLDHLINQGIDVYVIDNWSTDGTYETAESRLGRGVSGIERFPPAGPSHLYRWEALLRRVEEVSRNLDTDWIIHHDVDEVRMAPWLATGLKDAVHAVDQLGFNAIDHTVLVFPPIDDGFAAGIDFASYFKHFEFAPARDFLQVKAWKQRSDRVVLDGGGHNVSFVGRRIYPFKFLIRHYPIRGQTHGERKVFGERRPRFKAVERLRGWHQQYESVGDSGSFLRSPDELREWDHAAVMSDHLLEALCGAASDDDIIGFVGSLRSLLPAGYVDYWTWKRGSDGADYGTATYDRGDVIYKQGTGDLALREGGILTKLDGDYFPRVIDTRATDDYSIAILESFSAESLQTQAARIVSSPESFHNFASECMNLLEELRRASVAHRDINDNTLLVRDSRPFLRDFTWARSPFVRELDFEPLTDVPPDGTPCDVYAVGRLLARINAGAFFAFDRVIDLMTEPDPALRITDVDTLKAMLDAALSEPLIAS